MCTAISFKTDCHYFGRNLDLEYSYNEQVVIVPRNYRLTFKKENTINNHYAFIGMATVEKSIPLFYDATNEKGLSMAALSFKDNAKYFSPKNGYYNITPFEFIPWVLSKAANVSEALELIKKTNLIDIPFSEEFALTPLHFIVSDRDSSITVESVTEGLKIYDNPIGILTNNPTFDMHMMNLNNYSRLSSRNPQNGFSNKIPFKNYSRGMGALGLPGDFSSASRFVKAAFVKFNSVCDGDETSGVTQFFHILNSVAFPKGSVELEDKSYAITVYSSCCNTDKGIYYYTTYENSQISAVDMRKENLNGTDFIAYPLKLKQNIFFIN